MATSYPELLADAALEGLWLLQDNAASTAVLDSSGNDRHLTANVNTSTLNAAGPGGHLPSAFEFTGSQTASIVDATLNALPQTHDMTVLVRVRPVAASVDRALWSFEGSDDLVMYDNDSAAGSGGTRVYWRDVGNNIMSEDGADLSGGWHNYAFITSAADNHRVRRDKATVASSSATGSAGPFSIFHLGSFDGASQFAVCRMAELLIFSRALSDAECDVWEDVTPDSPTAPRYELSTKRLDGKMLTVQA